MVMKDSEESTTSANQLLTVVEVAKMLKVPASWVYGHTRLRGKERIPHIKLGKYVRFHEDDVRAWLQSLREG